MFKIAVAAAWAASLAACSAQVPAPRTNIIHVPTSPVAPSVNAVNLTCDPTSVAPAMIRMCQAGYAPTKPAMDKATYEKHEQEEIQQERLQAYEEHRARAECSMRAQEANSNNWGLVHGFFAGLGTGSACINYYKSVGVIRN